MVRFLIVCYSGSRWSRDIGFWQKVQVMSGHINASWTFMSLYCVVSFVIL